MDEKSIKTKHTIKTTPINWTLIISTAVLICTIITMWRAGEDYELTRKINANKLYSNLNKTRISYNQINKIIKIDSGRNIEVYLGMLIADFKDIYSNPYLLEDKILSYRCVKCDSSLSSEIAILDIDKNILETNRHLNKSLLPSMDSLLNDIGNHCLKLIK